MFNCNIKQLRRIYKILLSASVIIAGICLIVGCLLIYFSGNGYSRETVGETFSKFSIIIYISLILIIGDIVWELISPTAPKKKIFKKDDDEATQNTPCKKVRIIQLCVLGGAIIILILGAIFGGYADVLTKAVNICTECIGLG